MKPHFIISSYMIDKEDYDPSYYNSWTSACKELGVEFSVVDMSPSETSDEEFYNKLPISCRLRLGVIPVFFGSIEYCRKIKKVLKNKPYVMFFDENKLDCSNYYPKFSSDIPLLNNDYFILEYKNLLENWDLIYNVLKKDIVFIRPNSNMKQFTGGNYLTNDTGKRTFIEMSNKLNGWGIPVKDKELCLVSSSKKIISEYRFYIFDKKVITGCQYNRDLALDVRTDILDKAKTIAEMVAKQEYQPEIAYTCDIAELDDETFKVVELNNGSTSGLYAMDKKKIVESIIDYCHNYMKGELNG